MKKICVIMGGVLPVPAIYGGGIETLIESIIKKYSREDGFELTICSVYYPEAERVSKKYPEIKFFWTHTRSIKYMFLHAFFLGIRILTGKNIRVLQRHYNEIKKLLNEENFDLIIAEGGDTQAILDIAKDYRKEQFVNHVHVHRKPSQSIADGYGNIIGVSNFITQEYSKVCNKTVRDYVLKNGINLNLFMKKASEEKKIEIRKKLKLKHNDFIILFVGRISAEKGLLELVQAVTELQDRSIKMIILGGANSGKWTLSGYEEKIKKLARKNGEQFLFEGYIENDEICNYAALADIQCIPTLIEEAAGLVLLEAMAAGLPTVITKSGGMVEYATEETSIIIERENIVENLKKAILYLKNNPEVREKMSLAAKKQSQQFNEEWYYRSFADIVKEILSKNAGQGEITK